MIHSCHSERSERWVKDRIGRVRPQKTMNASEQAPNCTARVARRPLRVLLIEDSEEDAFLISRALARGGFELVCERVDTAGAMSAALEKQSWDVVLADHSMPMFSAPAALELLKQKGHDLP